MRRIRDIPVLSLLLTRLPACIVSSQARVRPSADVMVRQASAAEVRALLGRDTVTLERLWSDDPVVTDPLNLLVNKQRILALIRSDTLAFQSYQRRIEYTRAAGDHYEVAGSEHVVWAGRMPMAGQPSMLRVTALWVRRRDRWVEVARHANIVPAVDSEH